MTSGVIGLVSDFAGTVASHLSPRIAKAEIPGLHHPQISMPESLQRHVPRKLDLNYITERIIGMTQPAEAAFPTRLDQGRDVAKNHDTCRREDHDENDTTPAETTNGPISPKGETTAIPPPPEPTEKPSHIPKKHGNCPATLSTFLSRRHSKRFLAVNVSDQEADDRTLLLLNRQIIRFPWLSPCVEKSETPELSQLFDICYAMHAFLSLDKKNVVLVYCSNGKTRTAIVVACYLKFCGIVKNALDGFRLFCHRRCPDLDSAPISDHIPPSLKTFFRNFNDCVELGGYANPKPLLLRAVALQGVPVDDKPCVDIWDSQQRHIYSSHPELWLDDDQEENVQQKISSSQWADEEGFYRVNKILAGDFVVLCRFGGLYADDSDDPSKILFRYANSSGFLSSGPYEFPKGKVDMMRRYDTSFDEEDFLLTLMFDSSLDTAAADEFEELWQPCSEAVLPRILEGTQAIQKGFIIIEERHAARPVDSDVEILESREYLEAFSLVMASVALQLTNHDMMGAQELLSGNMAVLGMGQTAKGKSSESEDDILGNETSIKGPFQLSDILISSEEACANVFKILDEVDVGGDMEWIDRIEGDLTQDWETRTQSKPESERENTSTEEVIARYNPIMMPNRGDIVNAFGGYNVHGHSAARDTSNAQYVGFDARPRMPMHTGRKRRRRDFEVRSSVRTKHASGGTKPDSGGSKRSRMSQRGLLVHDSDTASAMELLLSLSHTGVTLDDLLSLNHASHRWTNTIVDGDTDGGVETVRIADQASPADVAARHVLVRQQNALPGVAGASSLSTPNMGSILESESPVGGRKDVIDGVSTNERASSADAAAIHVLERQKESLPGIETTPSDAASLEPRKKKEKLSVEEQGGTDTEGTKTTKEGSFSREKEKDDSLDTGEQKKEEKGKELDNDPPLKDDPEYAKYFKMMKMGLPMDATKHAMMRDGKDPTILELDQEKSLKYQRKQSEEDLEDVPLREDPEYVKYFKMLKMGLPEGAVRNALQRDGKDPGIMDLDPDKSLKSQTSEGTDKDNDPPLKDDPEYVKYFKMLKMGLPEGAVRNALQRDGKDPAIMDLDPEKSLKSQTARKSDDDGPPLKDDPEFSKYFKMLKMGLPDGAVRNALQRDGKDPNVLDLDPEKSLKSQKDGGQKEDDGPPLKDDPEYSKYFKMLKMGLPEGAVRNALQRDGKDPGIMDLDPDKSLKSQTEGEDEEDYGPPLKDDPEFEKYFRMLKMLLPMGAIKQALQRDGKDPSIMDLDHNKSLKSQRKNEDDGPPLKDDPEFSKYFKMLKMGLPMGAVKNALQRDGKDTSIMDLDHNKSVASQLSSRKRRKHGKKEKKAVRRKKIYWTPIDPVKVHRESIWSLVQGTINMAQLKYDMTEFENLFTESSNPADKKKKARGGGDKSAKPKKSIQVIDGKRGMNGGIILARLKIEYKKLAEMVDNMESDKLDSTQLRALKEFLPTDEERMALREYLKKGDVSEDAKAQAMAALSECEKYMVAMLDVKNADAKFDCMLFKTQFDSRLEELKSGRDIVKKACDEVRSSERVRKMMAMILTLVNQINTGGSGKMAVGFSLDALLKLNEAKAFDKKTSVLQYLAKLVLENDKTLLTFKDDIASVVPAEGIILDSLAADMHTLSQELENVHKTAKEEADGAQEQAARDPDLKSETEAQVDDTLDAESGRTPMERFTLSAKTQVEEAVASIEDLKQDYAKLLEYFGEDEKLASSDFFGTINKFVVAFTSAAEQVEKAEKKRLKDKLRAAAKVAALAKSFSKTKSKVLNRPLKGKKGEHPAAAILKSVRSIANRKDSRGQDGVSDDDVNVAGPTADSAVGGNASESNQTDGAVRDGEIHSPSDTITESLKSNPKEVEIEATTTAGDKDHPDETGVSHSLEGATALGGGIAAAAAAAAALRSQERGDKSQETQGSEVDNKSTTATAFSNVSRVPEVFAKGGIAAAAAAAAAARSQKKDDCNVQNDENVIHTGVDADEKRVSASVLDNRTAVDTTNEPVDDSEHIVQAPASEPRPLENTGIPASTEEREPERSGTKETSVGISGTSEESFPDGVASVGNVEDSEPVEDIFFDSKEVSEDVTGHAQCSKDKAVLSAAPEEDGVGPGTPVFASAEASEESSYELNDTEHSRSIEDFVTSDARAERSEESSKELVHGEHSRRSLMAAADLAEHISSDQSSKELEEREHPRRSIRFSTTTESASLTFSEHSEESLEDLTHREHSRRSIMDAIAPATPETASSTRGDAKEFDDEPGGRRVKIRLDSAAMESATLKSSERSEDSSKDLSRSEHSRRSLMDTTASTAGAEHAALTRSEPSEESSKDLSRSEHSRRSTTEKGLASVIDPASRTTSEHNQEPSVELSSPEHSRRSIMDTAALAAAARKIEAAAAARAALERQENHEEAATIANGASRQSEAAAVASEALIHSERSKAQTKDAAALAAAARQGEAAALASAALARPEQDKESAREAAALAAAARQDEAAALASAALAHSERIEESSKDAAAEAAATRKNEAAAAVAAALAASRREREESRQATTASVPSRQNEAASAIAAALAASRQGLDESVNKTETAKPNRMSEVDAALAAARATLRSKREDSDVDFPERSRESDNFGSIRRLADVEVVKRGATETVTDDLAELLKARMAIRSAKQTLRRSSTVPVGEISHDKSPLRPSDVRASADGTGSRVDANSLLWDNDNSGYSNDMNAILWDNDDTEDATALEDNESEANPIKDWFRESMRKLGK